MFSHLLRRIIPFSQLKIEIYNSPEVEENRARRDLKEELCRKLFQQKKLKEQLQELETELKVVQASANVKRFMQDN